MMLISIERRWKRSVSFSVSKFSDDKINDLSFRRREKNQHIIDSTSWTLLKKCYNHDEDEVVYNRSHLDTSIDAFCHSEIWLAFERKR